jgi:predicted MPP superfamily phosphohydrolase
MYNNTKNVEDELYLKLSKHAQLIYVMLNHELYIDVLNSSSHINKMMDLKTKQNTKLAMIIAAATP